MTARRRILLGSLAALLVVVAVAALLARGGSTASARPLDLRATLVDETVPTHVCAHGPGAPRPVHGRAGAQVPARVTPSLRGALVSYVSPDGALRVLAPPRWRCELVGAVAGARSLLVEPPDTAPTSNHSAASGIVASSTGGCTGCALSSSCALLPLARSLFLHAYHFDCRARVPRGLRALRAAPWQATYVLPAGAATLVHVPAAHETYGAVVLRVTRAGAASWSDQCALPSGERDICLVNLRSFLARDARFGSVRLRAARRSS